MESLTRLQRVLMRVQPSAPPPERRTPRAAGSGAGGLSAVTDAADQAFASFRTTVWRMPPLR
jgi:hypothetical protein